MNCLKVLLLSALFLLLISGCDRKSVFTVKVSDFGLKPDTKENAIPAIIKAINECKKYPNSVLKFEKGRYDFHIDSTFKRVYYESNTTNDAPKNLAILIEGCTELTLDGGNSEFVFHG